jgi:hypothetical protein
MKTLAERPRSRREVRPSSLLAAGRVGALEYRQRLERGSGGNG